MRLTRNERHVGARFDSHANDLSTICGRWTGKRGASAITRLKISVIWKSNEPLAQMARDGQRGAAGRCLDAAEVATKRGERYYWPGWLTALSRFERIGRRLSIA